MIQNVRDECEALDAIYTNETSSGSDPSFTDTSLATKDEHIDVILLARDIDKFFTNQAVSTLDRVQWLTPFLANN